MRRRRRRSPTCRGRRTRPRRSRGPRSTRTRRPPRVRPDPGPPGQPQAASGAPQGGWTRCRLCASDPRRPTQAPVKRLRPRSLCFHGGPRGSPLRAAGPGSIRPGVQRRHTVMRMRSAITAMCVAGSLLVASGAGAGSFTVTVSPLIENGGWSGTAFLASNPTPVPAAQTLPTCDYANNTCDKITVTVANITQAYIDANPTKRIIFSIDWPDANADFDLYVTNAADAARLTASASGDRPEIATLPLEIGTHTYTLRVVPYTVLPLDNYTGTVKLATPAVAPPPPNLFGLGEYRVGADIFSCNFHVT